eukprot:gene23828-25403_t
MAARASAAGTLAAEAYRPDARFEAGSLPAPQPQPDGYTDTLPT